MSKKVYIGVGHGGSDPGAVANGLRESDLNLAVSKACYDYLKARGINVKISRTSDKAVWLTTRIKEANAFNADIALDIHHNAGGGDGAEVYHTISGGEGKKLAELILAEMQKIGQNSRGTKIKKNNQGKDYFGFIRQTNMPACLVECAFVDNKKDVKIVDTKAEQKKMGEAIAKACLVKLGVEEKVKEKEEKEEEFVIDKVGYTGSFPKLPAKGFLQKGDEGTEVRKLQKFLKWYGYDIKVDGDFGEKTDNAVRNFQEAEGLSVDGDFGEKSLKKAKAIKK